MALGKTDVITGSDFRKGSNLSKRSQRFLQNIPKIQVAFVINVLQTMYLFIYPCGV